MSDTHPITVPAVHVASQDVVIPSDDGVSLAGTLERPPAIPAMLLIQGSGPVDRDGNVPGAMDSDLQKQIADALAEVGIASLRYDKRGEYANKEELPKDKDEIADFVAWERMVGDAVAGWRFLREQPGIDRDRVGLFGHSEGGIVALDAARHLAEAGETPAALILAATPGRPMAEILHDQIERLLKTQGVKPDKAEQMLDAVDNIQEEIVKTGEVPDSVPAGLKPLYRPELGQYWHSLLDLDPAELAKVFPGPVLVIEGTADKQVSARDDALTLDEALSERPTDDHDLLIVPRLSHELKPVTDPAAAGDTGPIKPSLVKDITDWVTEKLLDR